MKNLRLFEEFNEESFITIKQFKEKYNQYINSGDIKLKSGQYEEILVKKTLNLPSLEKDILSMFFNKDTNNNPEYIVYWVTKPHEVDMQDVIGLNKIEKLLELDPLSLKKELQKIVFNKNRMDSNNKKKVWYS